MACWAGGRCIQLHPEQARELEGMSVAGESTIRMMSLHRRGGRVALDPEPALEEAEHRILGVSFAEELAIG